MISLQSEQDVHIEIIRQTRTARYPFIIDIYVNTNTI